MRFLIPKPIIGVFLVAFLANSMPANADHMDQTFWAIGDLHGDLKRLVGLLTKSGLVEEGRPEVWTGGTSALVITGDFMDRGTEVRALMDFLIHLQKDATKSGGQVVVLLGNHEMMNIVGDYRYVSDGAVSAFAGPDSEKVRRAAFSSHLKLVQRRSKYFKEPQPTDLAAFEATWMAEHPPGFIEYIEALGPGGKYGRWLRDLPALVRLGDLLYVHGGIHPSLQNLEIEEINAKIRKERRDFDFAKQQLVSHRLADRNSDLRDLVEASRKFSKMPRRHGTTQAMIQAGMGNKLETAVESILSMGNWLSVHKDGPLWFRGYATWKEDEGGVWVRSILGSYQASYIVVGHTIASEDVVVSRFDDRVFLLDTLRPSILMYDNGRFESRYLEDPSLRFVENSDGLDYPATGKQKK